MPLVAWLLLQLVECLVKSKVNLSPVRTAVKKYTADKCTLISGTCNWFSNVCEHLKFSGVQTYL